MLFPAQVFKKIYINCQNSITTIFDLFIISIQNYEKDYYVPLNMYFHEIYVYRRGRGDDVTSADYRQINGSLKKHIFKDLTILMLF